MSEATDKILAEFCQKMYQLKVDHYVRLRKIEFYSCVAKWSIAAIFLAVILAPIVAVICK